MDAGTPIDGSTSAWSYQQDAQLEAGSLQYHARGHRRESDAGTSALPPADQAFDGSGGAPVIAVREAMAAAGLTRQALHASVLGFVHPITGETLRFETQPPADMRDLEAALSAL